MHPFQIRVATLIPKLPNLTPLWIRVATLIEFRSLFVMVAALLPWEAEHRKLKGALEHRKKWPQEVFFEHFGPPRGGGGPTNAPLWIRVATLIDFDLFLD